jgi:hypothetical protein
MGGRKHKANFWKKKKKKNSGVHLSSIALNIKAVKMILGKMSLLNLINRKDIAYANWIQRFIRSRKAKNRKAKLKEIQMMIFF